ncbi:10622_t:CDS:1, partial [Racocetra fulgida]
SIPIVVIKEGVNESSEKRSNRQLLPTPIKNNESFQRSDKKRKKNNINEE